MFGSNTVQSSWANPQQNQNQNQPQQQGGSAFGQPSGFGTGAGFGTTGAFGQPQQPQANPMFGNLATPSTGTSAFGTFGQNAQQPAAGTSAFGAPKPATGFGGAFGGGGTSAFGSGGNTFGATAGTGTTAFGSNTNAGTGGAFGTFGQNRATAGFGATSPTTSNESVAPVTTGTSNPPYNAFGEKDPTSTATLQYQTITAMPAYRGTSLEELRHQDYQQGRKTAGAFGQPSFGATTTQPTGLFGGAPTQPASTSMFGGGGTGTSTFGGTGTAGNTGTGFGSFTQPQPAQPSAGTGTGIFGSTFGQPQQQQPQSQPQPQPQQPSTFGTFGQPQQQQTTTGTGIFGSGGAFGQQNKPTTGFGGGSTFGPTTGGAFGSTAAFGQPAPQPAAGTTGIFGQPQQQQPATGGTFGSFGSNTAAKPSIFGQPAQPNPAASTGFGTFGNQPQQQQPQQPQTGGIFGNTSGNMFGQPQQQQPPQQTGAFGSTTQQGGIFGGTTTGGGLFGNVQQNQPQPQQPAQTGGIFGTKPATTAGGSLFGPTFGQSGPSGPQLQTNVFGQPAGQATNQQPAAGTNAFGSSLFGPKPVAPGLGTSTSAGGGLGSSLYGGQSSMLNVSATVPGAQGTLFASIAEPLSQNLPIFSMLPPGPRAVDLDQQPKKKPGFFVDVPTRSPVPHLQLGYTPANSKLRGFASSTSGIALGSSTSPFATSLTNGKSNALALSRLDGKGSEGLLGRSSTPSLGSGGRQSVKKLILDKKVEPADLFSQSSSRASPNKVTFSPALSQAAREKEVAREKEAAAGAAPAAPQVETPAVRKAPGRFSAQSTINVLGSQPSSPAKEPPAPAALQHGSYWVKPALPTLVNLGYEDLVAFKDLVVGRVGYGEIHFLEPVDLTNLPRLGALLGEIVKFDDKECSVYPDTDDAEKPAPGSGLNVRARIILVRCWATDKATREPIKDEKNVGAVKHLKRLKTIKDTHFEGFEIQEGKWTFTVDHF
ncbi:nucleoporin autopeptidase-domain-containing protein [Suillus paluster]|uniref:nucleoporin autopeptidase-domain-containing protein n=1 Tax=Suillus paluster TaxID=48578 RepID=UPI001B861839|nr:nucleoporin autopeptidase-domain-containing protein [Suillus paluster]KAG1752484.1 nucleoporin autopeptidase-domain-containing protein [Suillus paluster]